MESISLNGHKLDEVKMLLVPYYGENSIAYLSYPLRKMRCERKDECLVLTLPVFLTLELYRQAILQQTQSEPITVEIDGSVIGYFRIVDFRYSTDHSVTIIITLEKAALRLGRENE